MHETDQDVGLTTENPKLDKLALWAWILLGTTISFLILWILYSALNDMGRLGWLTSNSWLLLFLLLLIVAFCWFLYSVSRPKNIVWRAAAAQFGEPFGEKLDRRNFGTGRGLIGAHAFYGLRCFGLPSGLEVGRIVSFINPPLYIPWSKISKIDTYPNLLTGRKEFETDMQAQITLRDEPELHLELPWLVEYRQLLPKSVKYRAIKLSKK